jgi:hypothetical protein
MADGAIGIIIFMIQVIVLVKVIFIEILNSNRNINNKI